MSRKYLSILVILLFLLSSLISMVSSYDTKDDEYDDDYYEWECKIRISFEITSLMNYSIDYRKVDYEWVIFGEATDANDGPPHDPHDAPHPPPPPPPMMVLLYSDDGLSPPFNQMKMDYRRYPDTFKMWNLTFIHDLSFHNFTISWQRTNLYDSEYSNIYFIIMETNDTINLFETDSVNRSFENLQYYQFKIICGARPLSRNIRTGWNFVSVPFNQSISKNDIIVFSNDEIHNWTDAVAMGSVYDFIFGWNRQTQTYSTTDTLEPGNGYWIYFTDNYEVWAPGNPVFEDDYITSLKQKWNIISIPYTENVSKDDILVDDVPWDTAVGNGWISDFIFGWSCTGQSYNFADTFMPGYAYWMYAYQNCTIYTVLDNFTIKAKYYYFRSYRNGGGIFPIYMIPRHDFDGNVSLSINADANLTAQLDRNILNTSSMVAELTIRPNNNTSIDTHAIELFATQENTSQNIYLEVEMVNVTIGEPDSYLTGKRDEFISWLESEHPEFGNLSDENWFAYKTYPQILVVSHWTFLSSEWEFRICCHNTIPPYNWSKMCLRRFGEIEPVLAAHREYDGITYEIPVDDYPIKYGY